MSAMDKLESLEELFAGRHFDREVIILCVRWYLRFKLSLRDLVEMMAERGLSLAHTTIMRWGPALHTGVREALAPICPCNWSVVAC
jgi:transposase-like protein